MRWGSNSCRRLLHQTLRRTDLARRHGDQRPAPDDPPDQMGRAGLPARRSSSRHGRRASGRHFGVEGHGCGDRLDAPAGSRGRRAARREMFRADKIEIPSWASSRTCLVHPEGTPRKPLLHLRPRGCARLREQNDVPFLGDIPIVQSVMDGSEEGVRPWEPIRPSNPSIVRSPKKLLKTWRKPVEKLCTIPQ